MASDQNLFDELITEKRSAQGDKKSSSNIFDELIEETKKGGKVAPAQPAAITQAPAKATVKKAEPTAKGDKQKIATKEGIEDLQQVILQLEDNLADTKPDTLTHKRISASLAEAKKELANYGMQPAVAKAEPAPAAAPAPSGVKQVASKNLRAAPDLEVPTPAAMEAERQRGQQARAATAKEIQEASALQKYGAPLLEVPLAVATALPGLVYQQATGKYGGYEPRSPVSREIMGGIGEAFEASKLEGLTGLPILRPSAAVTAEKLGAKAPVSTAAKVEPTLEKPRITYQEWKAQQEAQKAGVAPSPMGAGRVSVGAAAVPDATTIQQALLVASPELRAEVASIPKEKVNLAALQRQIEADSIGVRLTEGQAQNDSIKLSNEFNRRSKDLEIARRLDDQSRKLIQAIDDVKDKAAPDVFGARTMDHGQAVIDAYKTLDNKLNVDINAKYKALRDAAGGQFPVDAPSLLKNVQTKLRKELLSNDAPPSQFKELERLAKENAMTFEDFLSLRRNLGQIARTSTDGNMRTAAGYMIEELEKLPLQEGAKKLKPLADQARKAARDRFQMLEKDPAYRAAVDDKIAPEKFIDKFVIGGVNKNIQTMLSHLDDTSRQHMAAGVMNYLRDRALDAKGNFTQAQYNKALKALDDANKLPIIFDGESAGKLKTIGNVGRYVQAEPAGAFKNYSGTFLAMLADRGRAVAGKTVETGLNMALPFAQVGTTLMEAKAARAAAKETERALKPGAGIRNE